MIKSAVRIAVWGIILLNILAFPASGEDLSKCQDKTADVTVKIHCALWRLLSFLGPQDDDQSIRVLGPISLGPEQRVEVEVSVRNLTSPWPDTVTIRFIEGSGSKPRLIEEIKDHGLNGMSLDDPGDYYLRYQNQGEPVNLLRGLDENLLKPMNDEYLSRLQDLLNILEQKTAVHGPILWREVAGGLEICVISCLRYIRLGDNKIVVLRINPALYDFVPYSQLENEEYRHLNVEGWARKKPEAMAIFNAGQYYPDDRYIGLLWKDGVDLGSGLHSKWKALLLSGRIKNQSELPYSTILDLDRTKFRPETSLYHYAIQSFMLLDDQERLRVRQSDSLASRTIVAQDVNGQILVIMLPGAATLHEMALWLKSSDLEINQAMNMDGGFEAQLWIKNPSYPRAFYGSWVVNDRRQYYYQGGLKVPLPTVIAVVPRSKD